MKIGNFNIINRNIYLLFRIKPSRVASKIFFKIKGKQLIWKNVIFSGCPEKYLHEITLTTKGFGGIQIYLLPNEVIQK